jgi:hypothetical protein
MPCLHLINNFITEGRRCIHGEREKNDVGNKVEPHHCAALLIYDEANGREETETVGERE